MKITWLTSIGHSDSKVIGSVLGSGSPVNTGPSGLEAPCRQVLQGLSPALCQRESSAFVNATQATDAEVAASATVLCLRSWLGAQNPSHDPLSSQRHLPWHCVFKPRNGILILTCLMCPHSSSVLSQTPARPARAGWDTEPIQIGVALYSYRKAT